MTNSANPKRGLRYGLTAALLLSCSPSALHAETNADLAAEIQALKAQIREMRAAIGETRRETRKVRAAVSRTPAPAVVAAPVPVAAIPPGATPVFVTADKKMQFGAITITPGGFLAAESVFRSRTTQSDINTDFRTIPFGNSPLAHLNELRFSARQSRVSLLAEGAITPTFVAAGYMELDFLAAPNTANENQSNGFSPRIRHLYATLDNYDYGMHVLAGQNWSLATLNSKGITPRNEVTPPSIDAQYVPGFVWARQPGIRLTKDFGQKLWLSLAAEESQTTFLNGCPSGANTVAGLGAAAAGTQSYAPNGTFRTVNTINGVTCSQAGTGGGLAGDTNNFSVNHVPDVIAKAAYEAHIADRDVHLETFGIYRDFYDRVSFTNTPLNPATGAPATNTAGQTYASGQNVNHDTTGYGVGGGLIIPVIPKRVDFQASGMYGRGVGRYGTSTLADTTFNPDGSLRPLQEGMLLGGFTVHVTPAIDVYAFSGIEKEFRNYTQNTVAGMRNQTFYGLGAPGYNTASNQGCNLEANTQNNIAPSGLANTCTSTGNNNIKQIFQLTAGMWDKIYKGSFGEVRVGVQYSFTERQIYNNVSGAYYPTTAANTALGYSGNPVAVNSFQPKAYDHMIFTSLRYYPFQ